MTLWQHAIDLNDLNRRSEQTLASHLSIYFIDVDDNTLTASMPVNSTVHQPLGILHGGASCVLAETVGSTAANCAVNQDSYYCVGLDININHIRQVRQGHVLGISRALHIGKSTQVWHIDIVDDIGKTIAVSRLTMAVLKKR